MRKKTLLPAFLIICFGCFPKITSAMEVAESTEPSLPASIGSILIPLPPEQLYNMLPKRYSQKPAPAEIQAFHTTYTLAFKDIMVLFETKELLEIIKNKAISDQKFQPIIADLITVFKNIQKHALLTKQSLGKFRTQLMDMLALSVPYLNLKIPQMTLCFPDNQTPLPSVWNFYARQYIQSLFQSHHKYHPASKTSIEFMKLWLPLAVLHAYALVFEATKPKREKIAFTWIYHFIRQIHNTYKIPPSFTLFIPDTILRSALTGIHHSGNIFLYVQELLRRNICHIVELKTDLQNYLEKILSNTLPEKDYNRVACCFDALLGPENRYLEEKTPDIPICTGALLLHCQLGHQDLALYYAQKILKQDLQDPPPLLLIGLACAFIMNHQPEYAQPLLETLLKIPSEKFSWRDIPKTMRKVVDAYLQEFPLQNSQPIRKIIFPESPTELFHKRHREIPNKNEKQTSNNKKLRFSPSSVSLPELPDEVIDLILTNLSWTDWENIRLTSQRFRLIAEDPQTASFKGLASFFQVFQNFKNVSHKSPQLELDFYEDYLYKASEGAKKLKSTIKDLTNQKAFVKKMLQKAISTPAFVFGALRLNLVSEWPETMIHAMSHTLEDKHPEIHDLWLPFASIIALEKVFSSYSNTEDPSLPNKGVSWWQNQVASCIHQLSQKIFDLHPQHQEFQLLAIESETSRPLLVLMKEENLARIYSLLKKYLVRGEDQYFMLFVYLAQQLQQLTQQGIAFNSVDFYQNELSKLGIWISALSDPSIMPQRYNDPAHHYLRAAMSTVLYFLSADFEKTRVWLNQAFLYSQQFDLNDFAFLKFPHSQPYHLASLHHYAGNLFFIQKDWHKMLHHYDEAKHLGSILAPRTLCWLIKGALAVNDEKRAITYLEQLHQHQNVLAIFENNLSFTKLIRLHVLLETQNAPATYLQFTQRWKLRRIQQFLD
jgi:hypothetical protein